MKKVAVFTATFFHVFGIFIVLALMVLVFQRDFRWKKEDTLDFVYEITCFLPE